MKVYSLFLKVGEIIRVPPIDNLTSINKNMIAGPPELYGGVIYPREISLTCLVPSIDANNLLERHRYLGWSLPDELQCKLDKLLISLKKPNALLILRSQLNIEIRCDRWENVDLCELDGKAYIVTGIIGVDDMDHFSSALISFDGKYADRIEHVFDLEV